MQLIPCRSVSVLTASILLAFATLLPVSTATAAETTFEKRVLKFNSDEQWRARRPAQAAEVPYTFGFDEPNWLLQIEASAEPLRLDVLSNVVRERKRHRLQNPVTFTLSIAQAAGDGVSVSAVFVDEGGETHRTKPQAVPSKRSELQWALPGDVEASSDGDQNGRINGDLTLERLVFTRAGGVTTPATLRLTGASYVGQLDPVRFRFLPDEPVYHVRPGRESEARLELTSDLKEPVEVTIDATLTDYAGNSRHAEQTVTLLPESVQEWPLPFDLHTTGPKRLNLTFTYGHRTERAQLDFAYMEPAGVTPRGQRKFRFGTNANRTANPDTEAREFRAMSFIGIDIARAGYDWWQIEQTQGNWDWSRVDRLYANAELNEVDIQTALLYGVPWAVRPAFIEANRGKKLNSKQYWTAPPREELWRDYVRRHTERYRGRVLFYEIWNEPDLRGFYRGNTDEFLGLLKTAYEEIKQVNPEQIVMSPGMAHAGHYHGHYLNPDMYERVMKEGQDYFDVFAAHEHGTFEQFQGVVDGALARMRSYLDPPKPLYFNETAISSSPFGQQVQAETLVKKLTFAWARGASGYFWFNHRERAGETPGERGFGSVTPDFQPKAVYCAYNELIKLLRTKDFLHDIDLGPHQWGFVFGDDREQVLVYWASDLPVPATRPYALAVPDGITIETMDIMGNRQTMRPLDGRLLLTPLTTPNYLIVDTTESLSQAASPLVTQSDTGMALLRPGATGRIVARLHNPIDHDAVYRLQWVLPRGVTTEANPHQTIEVVANGSVDIGLPISVTHEGGDALAQRGVVNLMYTMEDTDWNGQLTVPVAVPTVFSGDPSFDRPPDVVLDRYAQVRNFAENDPSTEHLTWQGVDDLSASAWVGLTDDGLLLRVDVRDDRHVPPTSRRRLWEGDSVQLGLTLPGVPGAWEVSFSHAKQETHRLQTYRMPSGIDTDARFEIETTPSNGGMRYMARLPLDQLGWIESMRTEGIGFNLLVNDNDGERREGVIRYAPGIGPGSDPSLYPVVVFP